MSLNTDNVDCKNLILGQLPREDYEQLLPDLTQVTLEVGEHLYRSGEVIEYCYFPGTALMSLVTHMNRGAAIEVAVIGSDGMVGIPVLLGDDIAFEEAVVQVTGTAFRLRSSVLKELVQQAHSPLLTLLLLYTRVLMKQVIQTAACNRLHNERERLARWLLMCGDRLQSDKLPLTEQFLLDVLGLPPESVATAAAAIEDQGLIRCGPGMVEMLTRDGLEEAACECYRIGVVNTKQSGVLFETIQPLAANE
jgi:CRP-like cAMP-binding protein